MLFIVWTGWAWWALPTGLLVAMGAYQWMCSTARDYADLIESTFDVHRFALYAALRWPLPSDAEEERCQGEALTRYLWRGAEGAVPLARPDAERPTS
jgi:hypothetical protein